MEDVAQKLSQLRPFQFWSCKECGSLIFWATPLNLPKNDFTIIWTSLKIWIFPKFEGCFSKTVPSTPISILNFSRVWQSYFLRYTLEILITYGFFIDKKMMFYSFFCIFNKKAEIWEKLLFLLQNSPQVV